jgi:integrase
MPYLSPPTLTRQEVESLLKTTASHPRDHLLIAIALGTGLQLGEIVGLNVGDVYMPEGMPRTRVRLRAEIAKGRRVGDVFLPDALLSKLKRFRRHKIYRRERLEP